jgi:hypothetical protein
MARKSGDKEAASEAESAAAKGGVKRRRAAVVSTASTLQARALFASTRDELVDIQGELEALAEERRALIAEDAASNSSNASRAAPTSKAVLHLLPSGTKKT